MIKSKTAKLLRNEPPLLASKSSHYIGTNELIEETKEFLDVYYKGAFKYMPTIAQHRNAVISLESFASFIKTVFSAVFGKELVWISVSLTDEHIKFIVEVNTEIINEETRKNLEFLAKEALAEVEFSDGSIELRAKLDCRSPLTFSSVSLRRVYRALYREFFEMEKSIKNE